jgi:hypothetical protein
MRLLLILRAASVALAAVARPGRATGYQIPHTYIVQFNDNASPEAREGHLQWIAQQEKKDENQVHIRQTFSTLFQGYSAYLNSEAVEYVRHSPEVARIDYVSLSAPQTEERVEGSEYVEDHSADSGTIDRRSPREQAPPGVVTVPNRGWNAYRISHRDARLGYNNGEWIHDSYLGQNVTVYILDTG